MRGSRYALGGYSRIPKIVAARGFEMRDVADSIFIINQRGCLKTIEDIGSHLAEYREAGFKLIIIDAFYRAMPRGVDENDNGAVADVYNLLDRYAHEIGCAFVLIHHTSKGNQSLKAVTDVGSGIGTAARVLSGGMGVVSGAVKVGVGSVRHILQKETNHTQTPPVGSDPPIVRLFIKGSTRLIPQTFLCWILKHCRFDNILI